MSCVRVRHPKIAGVYVGRRPPASLREGLSLRGGDLSLMCSHACGLGLVARVEMWSEILWGSLAMLVQPTRAGLLVVHLQMQQNLTPRGLSCWLSEFQMQAARLAWMCVERAPNIKRRSQQLSQVCGRVCCGGVAGGSTFCCSSVTCKVLVGECGHGGC